MKDYDDVRLTRAHIWAFNNGPGFIPFSFMDINNGLHFLFDGSEVVFDIAYNFPIAQTEAQKESYTPNFVLKKATFETQLASQKQSQTDTHLSEDVGDKEVVVEIGEETGEKEVSVIKIVPVTKFNWHYGPTMKLIEIWKENFMAYKAANTKKRNVLMRRFQQLMADKGVQVSAHSILLKLKALTKIYSDLKEMHGSRPLDTQFNEGEDNNGKRWEYYNEVKDVMESAKAVPNDALALVSHQPEPQPNGPHASTSTATDPEVSSNQQPPGSFAAEGRAEPAQLQEQKKRKKTRSEIGAESQSQRGSDSDQRLLTAFSEAEAARKAQFDKQLQLQQQSMWLQWQALNSQVRQSQAFLGVMAAMMERMTGSGIAVPSLPEIPAIPSFDSAEQSNPFTFSAFPSASGPSHTAVPQTEFCPAQSQSSAGTQAPATAKPKAAIRRPKAKDSQRGWLKVGGFAQYEYQGQAFGVRLEEIKPPKVLVTTVALRHSKDPSVFHPSPTPEKSWLPIRIIHFWDGNVTALSATPS